MLTRSLSKLRLGSPTTTKSWMKESIEEERPSVIGNYLLLIPEEILFTIFSYLPLADIGQLCLTGSSLLTTRVVTWLNCNLCAKKVSMFLPRDLTGHEFYEVWVKKCKHFGVLCKRATMLCSTSNRLKLLASVYINVESVVTAKEEQNDWNKLLGMVGLAAATSTFILGWDESEYNRVLCWVRERKEVTEVIQGFRIFLWEFIDHEDTKASWLSFTINTLGGLLKQPSTQAESQVAEMLYLLLGPTPDINDPTLSFFQQNTVNRLKGETSVFMMHEHVPTSYEEAKRMFSELGKGLRLLVKSSTICNMSVVSSLMALFEGIHWATDNQAACLLFSCETVVKMFLSDLLRRKGGVIKMSNLLAAMVTVCGRLQNDLKGGLCHIIEWCFTFLERSERERLIAEFWKEIGERLEEGDVTEDILSQLGVLIGGKAYITGITVDRVKGCSRGGDVEE